MHRGERGEAIDLSLKVSLPKVEHTEEQESAGAADRDCEEIVSESSNVVSRKFLRLTNSHADLSGQSSATQHRKTCAAGVAADGAQRHPPVILSSRHSDSSDLRAVSPLAEESHDEGLHPGRRKKEREKVRKST